MEGTMLAAENAKAESARDEAVQAMALGQKKLIKVLKSSKSTEFARAKACQRLAVMGTKEAVPALSALLTHPKMAHYARFGLEPIPDPSVDDALRRALGQLEGGLLIGVINSTGQRRDAKAVEALAKLAEDSDTEVAAAAAAALGRIGTPESAGVLEKVLTHTKKVAGACLDCAERLLSQDNKEPAVALCGALLQRSDLPEGLRVLATRLKEPSGSP
jgi:HEAT repeat protein